VDPEEFSELQVEMYAEYQAKCEALSLEQEKYREKLHDELTKLKQDVETIKQKFEKEILSIH